MVQLIVWFRPEFSVNYRDGVFVSPAMQAIAPVNDILHGYPDAQVEPLFQDNAGAVPEYMQYRYTINFADADRAQSLQRELQYQKPVEAAYIKPEAELP